MTPFPTVLGFFVHIDAQTQPLAALAAIGAAAALLWFVVAQARRREERQAGRDRAPRRR